MNPDTIAAMLHPYLADVPEPGSGWPYLHDKLAVYLDLILTWNARTNLTAIRQPAEIVRRHFGESLFAAAHLGSCTTLLDYGSGAGFPGLPIQLLRPDVRITLAESQGKKAAFLREAVRRLCLPTEVLNARVESLPDVSRFDTVTLRAVDKMEVALGEAGKRAASQILILTSSAANRGSRLAPEFETTQCLALPGSDEGILLILRRC